MRIHFRHESATAEVNMVERKLGFVNSVYSRVRGQGHASKVLQDIVEWADSKDVVLLLTAQGYGNETPYLSNQELVEFYSRYGFRQQTALFRPVRMIRHPSRELQAP